MYDIASTVSRVANETYSHTRRIMPPQPWWDHLESSFHKFPDDFELDLRTELTVDATAFGDLLLRTGGATLLNTLALPTSIQPGQLRRDASQRAFYQRKANRADPESFFKRPNSRRVEVTSSSAGLLRFRPDDGSCSLLTFDSPFKPVNPKLRDTYVKQKRNMRAVAQYWRHDDGPRPTIAVIHGFMAACRGHPRKKFCRQGQNCRKRYHRHPACGFGTAMTSCFTPCRTTAGAARGCRLSAVTGSLPTARPTSTSPSPMRCTISASFSTTSSPRV